jgi:hypothetical protein
MSKPVPPASPTSDGGVVSDGGRASGSKFDAAPEAPVYPSWMLPL